MDQSTKIAGAMFIAFVVFVTLRGELPRYFAVLVGPSHKDSVVAPPKKQPGFFESLLGGGLLGGFFGDTPLDPIGTSSSTISYGGVDV